MKTTTRLLLVAAAPLLTAAPASAWCHRCNYSMAPMPMMPMMGFGAMPMMGFGAMPFTGLGALPTTAVGGSGFSMRMAVSGDATMALLLPTLFRNLLGPLLGLSPAAGMTEAQLQNLAPRIIAALRAGGLLPMTAEQANTMIQKMDTMTKAVQDLTDTIKGKDIPKKPSPEEVKARAEVRQLVEKNTRQNGRKPSLAQARAEVRRLVHEAARNSGQKTSLAKARAEVRRLVATGNANENSNRRTSITTTLASPAR